LNLNHSYEILHKLDPILEKLEADKSASFFYFEKSIEEQKAPGKVNYSLMITNS